VVKFFHYLKIDFREQLAEFLHLLSGKIFSHIQKNLYAGNSSPSKKAGLLLLSVK
jgi:hypothetical protein